MSRRAGAVALLLLLVGAAPAGAAVDVRVVGQPALYPQFDPGVSEYVARCQAGKPLRLSITAGRGVTVAVDGKAGRGGASKAALRMASGQSVRFVVRSGRQGQRYLIRCLPPDFPEWTAERTGQPQAAWYVVAPCCTEKPTYVAIFDTNGVPVWWINTHRPPLDASLLPDGNVAWAQRVGKDLGRGVSSGIYEEHRLDGKLLRTFAGPKGARTDRHELQVLPNGNYVVVEYKPRRNVDLSPYGGPAHATVLDALVEEVTPQRKVVWSWNSANHIGLAESGRWYHPHVIDEPVKLNGRPAYDIVHINAVERYGANRFLVSLRHTDAIYAIDKSTGGIIWKLGGTQTSRSLKVVGDDLADFGGQHDVRVLPDGTITLHDNGTGLGRPPRALRFGVDPGAMTATLLEQITDPDATDSPCCGSARKLPGGHWVISWGGIHLVTEATAAGKRVFALHFAVHISYRAFPVMPGRLKRSALRRGMDAMHPRR